ncbi:Asp-tRNA(Asn)/Glu-tRNA(Gln) amidotransferase subunit GatC [Clostridium cochlearium]|jgi:aspartyl-tRNA(Asn)/glutamyl-tRNA(Gln) amidotransferase subunit C|uniref:Aspartyl/glutamyl-tRNA(Asn/Gln) amidotransferase subunit C n=1 Tax=Clostridium cochlearium TaxID=1494 RepID=A0A240AVV5_CLOCO|nr:Asp-tRNA(Asn)/Glu-tRNA(Gln) amidotransferase subunit GatC [Clostridium cochlearium]MBV1818692.1 Asp-tRNA(Asn)/Glu-tRNA(Gln) amidotransferase subunit GatC [Bacteroidales bacterium MSK.15.36]NSJ90367.1 Asp-tRNA(Asn)/Glu-tRNA(Gln) amidotransferase subunit GatC [Coprococcus sp. MSK.21.13]MBE6065235.1 Asp-tRNA(Asn)/Glu-tRNA(Gln) amidotransferase subunit GatC [Clostridium cochlearium]MBU5268621.1 Asp-tRNA(Asn)/Glu-tRNA(Gln) amidotransferase subunit GatC [Clostridium cochlearium]MCG4571926.1 Asp-t
MSVTKKDVEHVAELARIELSESEKENMIEDLNKVLDYMKKLEELDTENEDIIVNPYYIENKFRNDEVEESMSIDEVMVNAPERLEEYILVPRIIED